MDLFLIADSGFCAGRGDVLLTGVGEDMPVHVLGQGGELENVVLPVHVHGDIDHVIVGVVSIKHEGQGVGVFIPFCVPCLCSVP